jgi:hypothetical protein
VSPAAGSLVFFVRVLGIMQKKFCTAAKLNVLVAGQSTVVSETEFIVGQKDQCFSAFDELIAMPAIRMTQTKRTTLIK